MQPYEFLFETSFLQSESTSCFASLTTSKTSKPKSSKKAHCNFINSASDKGSSIVLALWEINLITESGIKIEGSVYMEPSNCEGAALVHQSMSDFGTA